MKWSQNTLFQSMDGYMVQRCMLLIADLRYWLDLYSVWLSHSSLDFRLNDDLVFPPSTPQLGDHWSHPLHSKLKNALAQPQRTIMQMLKILKMIIIFKKRVSCCLICHKQTVRRHTNKQNNIFNMSDLKLCYFQPQLEHLDFWPLETFTWNWIVGLIINCHCRYNFHYIRAM